MKPLHVIWNFEGAVLDTAAALAAAFDFVLGQNFKLHHSLSEISYWLKIDAQHCATMLAKHYNLNEVSLLETVQNAYQAMSLQYLNPVLGVENCCIKVLNTGGKNVLVSDSKQGFCERFLIHHNMDTYFTAVRSKSHSYVHAPHTDSLKRIIRQHNMQRDRVYAVATKTLEVDLAHAANINAFFLCPLGAVQINAYRNISKLTELEEFLDEALDT